MNIKLNVIKSEMAFYSSFLLSSTSGIEWMDEFNNDLYLNKNLRLFHPSSNVTNFCFPTRL